MREFMIAFNPSEAADITIIVNNKPVNDISILPFSIQDRALYIIYKPKLLVKQKSFFVITKLQKAVDSISGDEESKLC